MSGKSKINIFKNMDEVELDIAIKEYSGNYRYYQRLIAMKLISIGFSFSKVGRTLMISYLTVHRWAKSCEDSGLVGLIPEFAGGRPSKITKSVENKLSKRIESEENISMVDVQNILKEEYNIDYSLSHVCNIVRKLGFDYIQQNDDNTDNIQRKILVKTG